MIKCIKNKTFSRVSGTSKTNTTRAFIQLRYTLLEERVQACRKNNALTKRSP